MAHDLKISPLAYIVDSKKQKDTEVNRFSHEPVQRIIDAVGEDRPTSTKHCKIYLSRLFTWGSNRGYCRDNPATGIELPKERKRRRLPSHEIQNKLVEFARERGGGRRGLKGSCPP